VPLPRRHRWALRRLRRRLRFRLRLAHARRTDRLLRERGLLVTGATLDELLVVANRRFVVAEVELDLSEREQDLWFRSKAVRLEQLAAHGLEVALFVRAPQRRRNDGAARLRRVCARTASGQGHADDRADAKTHFFFLSLGSSNFGSHSTFGGGFVAALPALPVWTAVGLSATAGLCRRRFFLRTGGLPGALGSISITSSSAISSEPTSSAPTSSEPSSDP